MNITPTRQIPQSLLQRDAQAGYTHLRQILGTQRFWNLSDPLSPVKSRLIYKDYFRSHLGDVEIHGGGIVVVRSRDILFTLFLHHSCEEIEYLTYMETDYDESPYPDWMDVHERIADFLYYLATREYDITEVP